MVTYMGKDLVFRQSATLPPQGDKVPALPNFGVPFYPFLSLNFKVWRGIRYGEGALFLGSHPHPHLQGAGSKRCPFWGSLLFRRYTLVAAVYYRQAPACAEWCSSSPHWHAEVWPRLVSSASLRAIHLLDIHQRVQYKLGVTMPSESCSPVLNGLLYAHVWRFQSSALAVCQPASITHFMAMHNVSHYIRSQCVALRIKIVIMWLTVSDNWFVFNVDSVYCTVFLCTSDRICSLLHIM